MTYYSFLLKRVKILKKQDKGFLVQSTANVGSTNVFTGDMKSPKNTKSTLHDSEKTPNRHYMIVKKHQIDTTFFDGKEHGNEKKTCKFLC